MKILLRLFFKDPVVKGVLAASLLLNTASWALIIFLLPKEEFLSLAYNIHVGISSSGPWWHALALPALGFTILVANTAVALSVFLKEKLFYYVLVLTAGAVQLLLLGATVSIIQINR